MSSFGTPNLSSILVNDKKLISIRLIHTNNPTNSTVLECVKGETRYEVYTHADNNKLVIPSGSTIDRIRVISNLDKESSYKIEIGLFDLKVANNLKDEFVYNDWLDIAACKKTLVTIDNNEAQFDRYLGVSSVNEYSEFTPYTLTEDLALYVRYDNLPSDISENAYIAIIAGILPE